MSYYKPSTFNLTNHAMQRLSSRLNLTGSVSQKYQQILDYYNDSFEEFHCGSTSYLRINKKPDYYFIVEDNTIITVTKLTYNKKMEIISKMK